MSTFEIIFTTYIALDVIATTLVLIALKRNGVSIKNLIKSLKEREVEERKEEIDWDAYADDLAATID